MTENKTFWSALDGISYCLRNPISVVDVYTYDFEVAYDMFCFLCSKVDMCEAYERPKISIRFENGSVLNAIKVHNDE